MTRDNCKRHRNRRIKRGTLGHRENPVVIAYDNIYHIGAGLVFQVIRTYGDSKYSHQLCEYIANLKKTTKLSGVKFIDIIKDFNYTE